MRKRRIGEQVVVVMGASSGIGRLAAVELAKRGAQVVVAARGEQALEELVTEIRQWGGKALAVVADTADFEQVRAVADTAERELGRIDTWVQAAAVAVYAPLAETRPDEFRQVIEVGLVGQAYGVLAALPVMRRHGGGTIIAVSSVEGEVALPFHSAYAAAKHGVNGMLDALRMELKKEGAPISVTAVMPASIDTPFFAHARTRLGVMPRPVPPVYDPQDVADAIVDAAVHPRRDVIVGGAGQMLVRLHRHFPRFVEALLMRSAFRGQRTEQPKSPDDPNNLMAPVQEPGQVRGSEGTAANARIQRRRRARRTGGVVASLAAVAAVALVGARRLRER